MMNEVQLQQETGLGVYQEGLEFVIYAIFGVLALILFVLFVILLVKLSKEFCIRRLEYKRYFSDDGVMEGEDVFFIEEFTNHSFVPMFFVDIETHISSQIKMQGCESDDNLTQRFISRFMVMPFTKIKRTHRATCQKRGYYLLETAKIRYAKVEVYLESKAELFVYPKQVKVEEERILSNHLQYSATAKKPLIQDNFSFAGIRKYSFGDALNAINYKYSAKYGEIMVNSREYLMGRKLLIYVNFQPNEEKYIPIDEFGLVLEKELSCAAYLLSECVTNGYQYAFHANSRMTDGAKSVHFPFGNGEQAYVEVLKSMACMRSQYGESMISIMDKDIDGYLSQTEIFLITTYLNEDISKRMELFEQMGNAVTVIDVLELLPDV